MWKKARLVLAASVVLIGGAAGFAVARNGGQHDHKAMKEKFDANGDGVLDDAERAKLKESFQARRGERKAAMVARFDTDKDGALDKDERAAMKQAQTAEQFKQLDANADGVLSLDEFKAKHGRHHGMRKRP